MHKAVIPMLIGLLMGSGPAFARAQEARAEDPGTPYQNIVSAMEKMVDLKVPVYLFDPGAAKKGTELDPMQYFTVLTDLSMPHGQVLDYVYQQAGSAGQPLFYVRPQKQKPYKNLKEYRRKKINANRTPEEVWEDISQAVKAKDTKMGFFEWVLFYLKAPQVYLWKWAATDYRLVCDRRRLHDVIEKNSGLPKETAEQARRIDPTPRVILMPEKVEVRIVAFTAHGGFFEEKFMLSRTFPHKIMEHKRNGLVEYNSGIKY